MRKQLQKLSVITMSLLLVLACVLPASVDAKTIPDYYGKDMYLNQESETVFIDGISYTYDYSYENNCRVIYITNNDDNLVEKVSYNVNTSTIYYNDKAIGTVEEVKDEANNINFGNPTYFPNADPWVTIESGSKYISYGTGASVAAVAGAIAIPLSGLGAVGVVLAMGSVALGAIAGCSTGGTVRYTFQRLTIPNYPPQHRYLWSFTASSGDYYGQYVSHL